MRAKRATFAIETDIKGSLLLDPSASEASHVCHRNRHQKAFKLDSYAILIVERATFVM